MSSTARTDSTIETMADLLDQLGGIPPERVRFQPLPGTATEADVLAAIAAPRKSLCELIDGVLVEKSVGYNESVLALYLAEIINAFVRSRNLGLVSGPDGTIRLWPNRVRAPDVAFVSWDRLPNRRRPTEPIPTLAPDLAIEILSTSNTAEEMRSKRIDYFAVDVRLVWEIAPEQRLVRVYHAVDDYAELRETDVLESGEVLPGFSLPLQELFAELDRQG